MLPTETQNSSPQRESMSRLAAGIFEDARRLVQLEVKLAAVTLREEIARAGRATTFLAGAVVLAVPASLLLGLALGDGLHRLTGAPSWLSHLLVALLFGGAAAYCLRRASRIQENS